MLKKAKYFIIIIFLITILIYTFIYPTIIINDIIEAFKIFIYRLFPSMFFFYTITDLLINYNFIIYIEKILNKLFIKIFHISGYSTFIIIMSMISGFPSGSKYIVEFLDKKLINKDTANYLLTFTHFSNPLFLISIITNLYNIKIAYLILIIHYISNFILAFIIRPKTINNNFNYNYKNNIKPFDIALKDSFIKTFKILLLILGNTLFFYTISNIFCHTINNSIIKTFIYGLFDLTKGLTNIKWLNISNYFKLVLILTFISLGGININMQVMQILNKKIDYKYFILGRISSLSISFVLILLCNMSNLMELLY